MPESDGAPDLPGIDRELAPVISAWARTQALAATSAEPLLTGADMTMAQFRLMAVLMRRGRLHGRDLSGELNISPSSLVPLIDRLEGRGQVRRVGDPSDRRVTWIELTSAGEAALSAFWQPVVGCFADALRSFSPEDREQLRALLTRVADSMSESRDARHVVAAPEPGPRRRAGDGAG